VRVLEIPLPIQPIDGSIGEQTDDPARVVTARQQPWNSIAYLNYIVINNG